MQVQPETGRGFARCMPGRTLPEQQAQFRQPHAARDLKGISAETKRAWSSFRPCLSRAALLLLLRGQKDNYFVNVPLIF